MDPDRFHQIDRQKVVLKKFSFTGWHLDVGGGGEGIVGLLLGDRVVAIDLIKNELVEASSGPGLKIVMDARELGFIDASFSSVSAFYSLMFMQKADLPKVFAEVYRVMSSGGQFRVWDHIVPPYDGCKQDVYVIPLEVDVDGKTVSTRYGMLWPDNDRDAGFYVNLARDAGFTVAEQEVRGPTFYLRLVKQ